MAKVAAVVPTCRGFALPPQSIEVDWIIVHDRKPWEVKIDDDNDRWRKAFMRESDSWYDPVYKHAIVAPDPYIYGERTSAIRQAGLDYAYDQGYDYILTLDDDCQVPFHWALDHVNALRRPVPFASRTVDDHEIRGYPSSLCRPCGISHGLWSGVLDYPAWYQRAANPGWVILEDNGFSPIRAPFPMCGMNVGFRREVLPAVYFQPIFRRHDDIFAGWMAERVLELHGYGFLSGGAVVEHSRASDAEKNLILEKPGDDINAAFLQHLWGFFQTNGDIAGTYRHLVEHASRLHIEEDVRRIQYQLMVKQMERWAEWRMSK